MVKYYIIELPKFKTKKPKVADLLEKWLYVIGGDKKMMEEYKNENEEIKEAVKQLREMSADEYERELYEIRERSIYLFSRKKSLSQILKVKLKKEKMFAKSIDNFKNCIYNKCEHFFSYKKITLI